MTLSVTKSVWRCSLKIPQESKTDDEPTLKPPVEETSGPLTPITFAAKSSSLNSYASKKLYSHCISLPSSNGDLVFDREAAHPAITLMGTWYNNLGNNYLITIYVPGTAGAHTIAPGHPTCGVLAPSQMDYQHDLYSVTGRPTHLVNTS